MTGESGVVNKRAFAMQTSLASVDEEEDRLFDKCIEPDGRTMCRWIVRLKVLVSLGRSRGGMNNSGWGGGGGR